MFQSTRPRGARLTSESIKLAPDKFQSTRPRGARPPRLDVIHPNIPFQSTRPRGARRGNTKAEHDVRVVSIHAPAWGATTVSVPPSIALNSFNPRARVGRDPSPRGCLGHHRVSIHAPAWGATQARRAFRGVRQVSIHAPAWGATRRWDSG